MQASYIVYLLPPYHANIKKRLVKKPKLYFADVGLASYLMGITDHNQIQTHPLRGELFENYVIMEIFKKFYNKGKEPRLSFYRDGNGNEVDLIITEGLNKIPIEIKASATAKLEFTKGLEFIRNADNSMQPGYVIYGGEKQISMKETVFIPHHNVHKKLTIS